MSALNQKGLSLVEAMVAVAVAGLVASALATVYVIMREQSARAQAEREAENLRSYVQGIVNQPNLCSQALGGIAWTPGTEGAISSLNVSGVPLVVPGRYSKLLRIERIYLREPSTLLGEGPPLRTPNVEYMTGAFGAPPELFTLVNAKLVIDTRVNTMLPASRMKPQVINVHLAVSAANVVRFCVEGYNLQNPYPAGFVCDASTVNSGDACLPSTHAECTIWYYVRGFDAEGRPECVCEGHCNTPPAAGP